MIQRHDTKARMSRAVIHNGVAYLCGQVAGPEARHGDIQEQTRSMLARVDALLEEIGSGRDRLLTATIYLKEGGDFAAMNEVWSWREYAADMAGTTPPSTVAGRSGAAPATCGG